MWDARQYSRYAKERSRAFFDLVAQVPQTSMRRIVDLGCGPGDLTRTLVERWPQAVIIGVDNSPDMLAKARAHTISGRLEFVEGDLATWQGGQELNLIVCNAALQWALDHERVLGLWAGMLAPAGTIAVQMPSRFQTPSQLALEETVAQARWRHLRGIGLHAGSVQPLTWYIERFQELGMSVNAWETIYHHVLMGEDPVLEWLAGSALRSHLARLPQDEVASFLAELRERLRAAYPEKHGSTIFAFPRIFFVARRQ
jgi:trans-aconitate 2-methyltransferase